MTFQWTLAAGFLYAEIIVLLLFCLPNISVERWKQFFYSRIAAILFSHGNYYFGVFVLMMGLLLADSIRQTIKYNKLVSTSTGDLRNNPQAEVMAKMNLFHAQRNLYISGFSLILLIVLRRNVARLLSEVETGMKDEDKVNQVHKELREALEDKSKELSERSEELERTKKDLAALKERNAGLTRQYDNLLEEYAKAQAKLGKDENKTGEEKKDN
ncbi:B-cell receptor-associated protein 31-like [Pocillopora verrucosa]|uniref:B-cell receptor-associated protein 31-like n=1 Tax=Pocillopora verrucosa TaxID=203993 RepID=UPI003341F3CA